MKRQLIESLKCEAHPKAKLIEDYRAGDVVCSLCGLVVGDRMIDVSSEWRTFSNDKESKDMSRVGAVENQLLNGEDLTTYVGRATGQAGYDEFGNPKYRNRKTMSAMERTLTTGFRDIGVMSERLNLPHCVSQQAEVLYKKVYDSRALRGRCQDAVISACIYIACRREGAARTFKEICAVSRSTKRDIGRCFKQILLCLEENVDAISIKDFMSRFCTHLNLNNDVQQVATYMAFTADKRGIVAGRTPITISAASIYMASHACGYKKSLKDIAEIAGVAESTIRQLYKALMTEAHHLYPRHIQCPVPPNRLPQV